MKNGIFHATLLGIVASASFSLTQAATLAATSPDQTKVNVCLVNPAQTVAPVSPLAGILAHPEQTNRFLLLGGH
jgi:hypothetical protein